MLLYQIGDKKGYRSTLARFSKTKEKASYYYFDVNDPLRRKTQKISIPLSIALVITLIIDFGFSTFSANTVIGLGSFVLLVSLINLFIPKKTIIDDREEAKIIGPAPSWIYIEWVLLIAGPALFLMTIPYLSDYIFGRLVIYYCVFLILIPFIELAYYVLSSKSSGSN